MSKKTKTQNLKRQMPRPETWEYRVIGASLLVVGLVLGAALVVYSVQGWKLMFPSADAASSVGVPSGKTDDTGIEPSPTFVRRVDGVLVDSQAAADVVPVSVMIENSTTVRPQSGLSQARVVYETLAEGGVTRFVAMFLPNSDIKKIGPVRSVRHYYLDWAEEYGGAFAHAGGSPLGLSQITRDQVPDLNGIGNAWRYFFRDRGLPAPHNLFTTGQQLDQAVADLKYPTVATFESWMYDDVRTLSDGARSANVIDIGFSGRAYAVRYDYNAETNTYLRFNGGVPHLDRSNDDQLRADNVIVQVVGVPGYLGEKGRIDIETIGTGKVYVFRNGGVIEGTWSKESSKARTKFLDANGQPIPLNRGVTWVAVTPSNQSVAYR